MFGKATIHGSKQLAVWKIPYEALLDGNAQAGYVFVTTDEKTAKKVSVVVGAIEREQVIIQSGLENYKWLITSGSAYLKEGTAVTIQR